MTTQKSKLKEKRFVVHGSWFMVRCLVFLILSLITYHLSLITVLRAQDCGADLDCQIAQIQREIEARLPAQEKNKADLASLKAQLADLSKKITNLSVQLTKLQKSIAERELEMEFTRQVFEEKTSSHYKFIRLYDPVLPFISSGDAAGAIREATFRLRAADEDRKVMEKYAADLKQLKSDKEKQQKSKEGLASLQKQVDDKAKFLQSEVDKVDSALASLSAKQNELIAAKAGGFQTSIGDTPPTLEPCSGAPGSSNYCDPGFRPAFGAFSFGAPHRTGMSQYGAYGRSKSGQSAETILAAYYQGSSLRKDYPMPGTIGVTGRGRISIEDNYLLGIYEVPESWGNSGGFEALKAQAVAARSYALAVTNNGAGTICATEACQVYKPQLKTGKWAEAVRATRGWVLTKDGSPAKAYFSASTGGYTISQWGWNGIKDTNGDWPGGSYEIVSGSPWFYKGWYKSRSGSACGRNNPWLTSSEMADIINAWKVLFGGGGSVSRISPVGACWGGSPYSQDELKNLGGYSAVTNASVIYGNNGSTVSVTFATDKGSITIAGDELKKAFNLRAPGMIGIKSSLFNIEKL